MAERPAADELRPLLRALGAGATWGILFLATPGILSRDGSVALATLALVPWALVASLPGRRAFAVEWLAAAIGISAICFWSTYVIWITLIAVALVPATYMAFAGVLLRRVARGWPLALAVPAAWVSLETLRYLAEPPFGFGWMRLGHHAHALPWLAGSARVFGTAGLSFVLAALAGGLADLLRARAFGREIPRRRLALPAATSPFGLACLLAAVTAPPATVDGPRLLLVQPAFPQERKMQPQSSDEMLGEALALTRRGLDDARRAGEPVDVVAWGETMMPLAFAAPDALDAWDRGVRPVPWGAHALQREHLARMRENEEVVVREYLYGRAGGLDRDTAFVSGVEHFAIVDGFLRRQNAVVAWDAGGQRAGLGGKVHLVPGAEHLAGLERLAWVRDTAKSLAGYVPDIAAFERAEVLPLAGREGRAWRASATVCFDNAFEGLYLRAAAEDDVDFHLVVSNEAWYRTSWEYDQMMAFTRLVALESGRSVVRATNAGISAVVGPDGREVARLVARDADRMVAGALRVVVPVPARAAAVAGRPTSGTDATGAPPNRAAPVPLYARTHATWLTLFAALGFALALFARPRAVTSPG